MTFERHEDICGRRIAENTDTQKDHVSEKVGEVHKRIDDLGETMSEKFDRMGDKLDNTVRDLYRGGKP